MVLELVIAPIQINGLPNCWWQGRQEFQKLDHDHGRVEFEACEFNGINKFEFVNTLNGSKKDYWAKDIQVQPLSLEHPSRSGQVLVGEKGIDFKDETQFESVLEETMTKDTRKLTFILNHLLDRKLQYVMIKLLSGGEWLPQREQLLKNGAM